MTRSRHPAPRDDSDLSCRTWTAEQVRALGTTTDIVTAGQILGLSRNTAYRLARAGIFPVPVLRAGALYRVPVAALLAALHLDANLPGVPTPPSARTPPTT